MRVFVEDTTARRRRRDRDPRLVLQIADCTNTINLEFSLETAQLRENSLFKVDMLLGAFPVNWIVKACRDRALTSTRRIKPR